MDAAPPAKRLCAAPSAQPELPPDKKESTALSSLLGSQAQPNGPQSVERAVGGVEEAEEPVPRPEREALLAEHQRAGVAFLWRTVLGASDLGGVSVRGCVLADIMGLGKTAQVLCALEVFWARELSQRSAAPPKILVLAPSSVLANWEGECSKWLAPSTRAQMRPRLLEAGGSEARGAALQAWYRGGGMLLLGYELFRSLVARGAEGAAAPSASLAWQTLLDPGPDVLVLDEAHRIRAAESQLSQLLMCSGARFRIAISGSPLQVRLEEYWRMVEFVSPGRLGSLEHFRSYFARPITAGQLVDSTPSDAALSRRRVRELRARLDGLVLRRGSEVLQRLLPPRRELAVFCAPSALQVRLLRAFATRLDSLRQQACGEPESGLDLLSALNDLRLLANHPDALRAAAESALAEQDAGCPGASAAVRERFAWCSTLLDEESPYEARLLENSGKFVVFIELLAAFREAGDRSVVFSRSLTTLKLLGELLDALDVRWGQLDGSTSFEQRTELVRRLNSAEEEPLDVLLVSTRVGGEGINLSGANRAVLFDASWNPGDDAQAARRCYRLGQRKPVCVYRLIGWGLPEVSVLRRQLQRARLAERVVDNVAVRRLYARRELQSVFAPDTLQSLLEDGERSLAVSEEAAPTLVWRSSVQDDALSAAASAVGARWLVDVQDMELLLSADMDEEVDGEEDAEEGRAQHEEQPTRVRSLPGLRRAATPKTEWRPRRGHWPRTLARVGAAPRTGEHWARPGGGGGGGGAKHATAPGFPPDLYRGLEVCVVPKGLGQAQLRIVQQRVADGGGRAVEWPRAATTTHLVSVVTLSATAAWWPRRVAVPAHLTVHSVEWLTESNRLRARLPEDRFVPFSRAQLAQAVADSSQAKSDEMRRGVRRTPSN